MALLFRQQKKPLYNYYVVEHSRVARVKQNEAPIQAEMLQPDGSWEPYSDLWNVCGNGRSVGEEQAYREARDIFEMHGIQHSLGGK